MTDLPDPAQAGLVAATWLARAGRLRASVLPLWTAYPAVGRGEADTLPGLRGRRAAPLRLQAEEAFADPHWREALGHALAVRAADNAPDPSRGLAGYVTTYQGVAAAPDLHLAEARRHRTLLVVDEMHHLPAPDDTPRGDDPDDAASGWSAARWRATRWRCASCASPRARSWR